MVAMKSALLKDTFREIKRTFSRFLSIFLIVALGTAFFAGVKATCPDMKITADKYFDDYNLMDIRLVSTIGFNDKDFAAVKKVSGVEGVMPTYSMDAMTNVNNRDLVLKVLSLPSGKDLSGDNSYINKVKLIQGRLPERLGECVAEKGKIVGSGMSIGSSIKLSSGMDKDISESLKVSEFTIVGFVETPYYISYDRGTSAIGSGKVNSFIMVPQEDFKIPAYTDIFVTVKNAKGALCYSTNYDNIIDPVKKSLENTAAIREDARYSEILSDANKELDAKKKELADARAEASKKLAGASKKLDDAKKKIVNGEKELQLQKSNFNITVKNAEAEIADAENKIEAGENEYSTNMNSYNEAKKQADIEFPAARKAIDDAQSQIDLDQAQLDALKAALANGLYSSEEQKLQMEDMISAGEQQLQEAKENIAVSIAELEAKEKSLTDAQAALENLRKALDNSKAMLNTQKLRLKNSIVSADAQFAAAEKKLESSRVQLKNGENNYQKAKVDSDKKLADAGSKIADGQEQISKIEKPAWYVLGRDTNPGFVDYGNSADRMDAIAQVFPVFFFLVAALVCLTTMTRMVDEQRIYIGTLKALGYSKISIASKYLLYAALASVGGSIFGLSLGFRIFPTVIFNAYGIMYTLPHVITPFNTYYAIISTAFAVIATTFAAFAACWSALSEEPASLMLPKAPKPGRRVFLERIKFIWSRFNFTQKITARNLLRYKRRFFMTVIGIAGCTALLLSGFGLRDSIMSIVTKQFDELYRYDMVMNLKENISQGENSSLIKDVSKDSRISEYMLAREQSIDVGAGKNTKSVTLFVPESINKLEDFIKLRVRTTGEKVSLTDDGVVLTEKLAKKLQVEAGSTIYIKNGDTKRINVRVAGITENYVSHYVYMSPALYRKVYGEDVKFQQIMAITTATSEDFENNLSTDLLKDAGVSSISFTTGISKNFNDIIGSLNYVVLVLIVSAGALAFIVLYNLTNINVTERIREIATIKVLGFYDSEVSSYVYRENIILTIIGMLIGLVLGIFLHRFIVVTAEVDYVMFGRNINPLSFLYSAIMTLAFSGLVNFAIYFRLKRISMVESLKSVD